MGVRARSITPDTRTGSTPAATYPSFAYRLLAATFPVLTDAQADALPAPRPRFLLSCIRELSSDPLAPTLGQHEDVLNLGNAQVCTDPSDVRVPDRPLIVPSDEVGRTPFNLLV